MNEVKNLIDRSGDSILVDYVYKHEYLHLKLKLSNYVENIDINVKTNHISLNSFYLSKEDEIYRTCRLELTELKHLLNVSNGIYVPNSNFPQFMKETKADYSLAYGKKANDFKHIFSLKGYDNLISCLIRDLDSINIMDNLNRDSFLTVES